MSESHPLNSLSSRDRGSDLVLPDESRSGRERFMWGAVLVLLTLIAYSPLLKARFIWDDDRYVTHNRMLRDAEGLKRIWTEKGATPQYYPLVHTMFWVEYHLWGVNPIGYHLVNVILHAAGGVMLWLALRRLRVPGAWLAAAIFLLHPIQVESVAWVTERKNVLAGLLFFSSIWAYLRFARIELDENKPAWGWYLPSLALFAGALFSKTIACSMPAVMVLILWWKRKLSWKQIVALLPFFAIGLFMALGTAAMERNIVGAGGEEWALTPMQRILIAGRATCFYAGKLIWPVHLTFIPRRGSGGDRGAGHPGMVVARAVGGGDLFSGDADAGTGIFRRLSDALFVRRGPFSISVGHRPGGADRGFDRALLAKTGEANGDGTGRSVVADPWRVDVAADARLRRRSDIVAGHACQKPRRVDRKLQPGVGIAG
jgi:hypothetical protein